MSHGIASAAAATVLEGREAPFPRRAPLRSAVLWVVVHCGSLIVAVGCLAAYEHLRAEGQSALSLVCLAAAAGFGFAPVRHLIGAVFGVERKVMHVVHGVGALALVGLPLSGMVSGAPVLTHAAMAPFALMGAAQAVMHQDHPRDQAQAAALRRFATSLPQLARFARAGDLTAPGNARQAVAVLADVLAKAQALGETELRSDPGFQGALRRVCTRFGAGFGLDAVQLVLARLASSAGAAGAVPGLREQLALARRTFAGDAGPLPRSARGGGAPIGQTTGGGSR